MNSNFETPDALRHDSRTLADEARALLEATADVADEKVTEARKRLTTALASAKECARDTYQQVEEKALAGARQADSAIRSHPYESIALALGAGSESRGSMGIAVIGGMVFSTLLTLYVIPAIYSYLSSKKANFLVDLTEEPEEVRENKVVVE